MLKLRDYQEEAVKAVVDRALHGVRRQLVVLPTGAGKTVVAAALSQKARGRVLMLVNREELVEQSVEKMGFVWPGQEIGVVKADRDEHDRRVVVASIQTLQHERRRERIDKDSFSLVIVDEAHHAPAPSVMATLTDLGFLPEPPPGKLLMGMTATPMRGDGVGLNTVFDEIVYRRSIADLIRRGYLADIKGVRVRTEIDLQKVRVQRGDFQTKDLSLAVDTPKRNAMIVSAYREHGEGRKALGFTVDVDHAQHLAEAFREAGYRADWVSGELPVKERRERLRRFRDGELDALMNAMLLTEGWDEPSVGCLLMTRPTKSTGLYCLDLETEILTPNGFRRWNKVGMGDVVAGFDPQYGSIAWVPVTGKVVRPLAEDERMIHLRSPGVDLRVSDHHRMLYRPRRGKRSGWQFREAHDLAGLCHEFQIPVAGFEDAPGVPLSDDELRFIGWFLTDGTLNRANNAIQISQSAHQPHHEAIRSMLEGCQFRYGVAVNEGVTQFVAQSPRLVYHISKGRPRRKSERHLTGWERLEPYIDKNLAPLLETMTARQLGVMLEAMHLANGMKQLGQKWTRRSYHICTGNKVFAERVQSLCVRRGFRCNLAFHLSRWGNPVYMLHIKPGFVCHVGGSHQTDRSHMEVEPWSPEWVWCVENPMGTLITRRNGKVAIMGNCQMVGRGLRPYPGKDYCVVIDVTDNAHDVCAIGTLEGEGLTTVKTKQSVGPSGLPAEGREEPGEIDGVRLSATPLDLLSRSRFKWRIERRRMVLEAGPGQVVVLEDQGEDRWTVTLAEGRNRQELVESPLPLSYAQGVAEDYVRENDLEGFAARDAKWRSMAPSKKQVERMQILGITPPYGVTREEANDLIREAVRKRTLEDPNAPWRKEPASPKQIDWMEKHGFPIPDGFTKGDFNDLMDRMKHRGKKHA